LRISEREVVLLGAFLPRTGRHSPPRGFGWLFEARHADRVGEAFGGLRSALSLAGLPLADHR
jgi:hypothetical protein